ncbi:ThiF family adenylyltransferase (plasmid) [Rhodococcus ruber]|uniref:ThiF family adenylyltransferase n=1 Tax=Rhodococcus ruber TaxID=1830 RepID=UPI00200F6122|nr:ThiF family adenylyltransferase [Rhodococcus ruber]UQB75916.1 ThiF family adenylyltransferase [Rhodococcus ruber]
MYVPATRRSPGATVGSDNPQMDARENLRLACVDATERLVDALSERGFEALTQGGGDTWRGMVHIAGSDAHTVFDVQIQSDHPYAPPNVTPLSRAAAEAWLGARVSEYYEPSNSWHRERGGQLCLFEQEDHTRLPWADPDALLDQVQAWLAQDRVGWPDDLPALDLERYLEPTGEVVLYSDIQKVAGCVVKLRGRNRGQWTVDRPAKVPRSRRGKKALWARDVALVLDIGELTHPIRDWVSLLDAAGDLSTQLLREVKFGVRELALIYSRGDATGVLAVRLVLHESGWTIVAHRASSMDGDALTTRSHPHRAVLAQRRVTIVGVGAVGSVLCDLLHRSGVGELHLIDPDTVLPGNIVRHLVDKNYVGKAKVDAVKATLHDARPWATTSVTTETARVSSLKQACEILATSDVVVDASADSTASPLIAAAARAGAGRALGVAVLADGYAIRVDHWPEPLAGALRPPLLPPATPGPYETGCSSPVSTTPPTAVWEAAALGARHAIDALLGDNHSAGEERIIRAGDGAS